MAKANNVNIPDFAYPKTVSTDAHRDLTEAVESQNATAAINALIRIEIADTQIDPSTLAQTIKLAESTAEKFVDSPLAGIFDALIAKMYALSYNRDRWTYDNRTLPIEPLPADITEWSGEQYRAKIKSLCDKSISAGSIALLKDLSISDYSDIVTADALTSEYYPKMSDFAFSQAIQTMEGIDINIERDIYERALSSSVGNIPAQILWQTKIDTYINDEVDEDEFFEDEDEEFDASVSIAPNGDDREIGKDLLDTYEKYSDSPYSSYILTKWPSYQSSGSMVTRYLELAEKYLERYPDNALSNNIRNNIKKIKQESVHLRFPNYCGVNASFEVLSNNRNATDYDICAYFVTEDSKAAENYRQSEALVKKAIASSTPVVRIPMHYDKTLPFRAEDKVSMRLPKPGYYVIVAQTKKPNSSFAENSSSFIRCIPVLPTVVNATDNLAMVLTVDPVTGAPLEGVKVKVYDAKDNNVVFSGTSDVKGITRAIVDTKNRSFELSIGFEGKEYKFPYLYVSPLNDDVNDYKDDKAEILTNRALYHQGDEIEVLGVFYSVNIKGKKPTERKLTENTNVKFELLNANYKPIDTIACTTDDYGRAICKFKTPVDGLTGNFTIRAYVDTNRHRVIGTTSVMVSDYVMPEYELTIEAIECDTPEQGAVTVRGLARSYSGMPMASIKINVDIKMSRMWWFDWQPKPIYSTVVTTDDDGKFSAVVPKSAFKSNKAWFYLATVEGVSSTGSTANASRTFALQKKYQIDLSIESMVNGEEPVYPNVRVYDAEEKLTEIPLVWELRKNQDDEPVVSGDYYGKLDLSKIKPGTYKLYISPKEKGIANTATRDIVIYNQASGIVPDDQTLWLKSNSGQVDANGKVKVSLATGSETSWLYYTVDVDGSLVSTQLGKYGYGYHDIEIVAPQNADEFTINLIMIKDCKYVEKTVKVRNLKPTGLKIIGDSFRDNLIPTQQETWNLSVVQTDGTPIPAAMALDMYNKALEALKPHTFKVDLTQNIYYGRDNLRISNARTYDSNCYFTETFKALTERYVFGPEFNFYDFDDDDLISMSNIVMMRRAMPMMQKNMALDDCCDEGETSVEESAPIFASAASVDNVVVTGYGNTIEEKSQAKPQEDFDYRESDMPMAVWAPSLTTDVRGNIRYTFTVPNANTTWRLQAVAWAKDMQTGQLMHDFVASKPVMVSPNLPRFMRSGDKATILASVMNSSDSTSVITTVVELFNPVTGTVISQHVSTDTIEPKKSAVVPIDIAAASDMTAIGYRVRSSNGDFADGEQNVIRILPSQAALIETTPFYLNPGEKEYCTQLPQDQGARISLTFCENPAWTIVTALPGLRTSISEYANSAAAALYSAAIAQGITRSNPDIKRAIDAWQSNPTDSALVSMLEKNQDLKLAVLNSTPWVQAAQSDTERMGNLAMIFDEKETNASIDESIGILTKLQKNDGGWAWGTWCDESSVWVTGNVLSMLGNLKYLGWLPKDKRINKMIERAVKYYDSEVKDTDLLYAVTRPQFSDIAISANGKKVIAATLKEIKKEWKHYTIPSYKALAAEALWLNGEKGLAKELMRSVSEYGVYSKDQGLRFPSVNALYHYAMLLDAYAMIKPGSKEVDGLRQQLIVRKQATDWGDAVVTTEVVQSILSSGSNWLAPAQGADITVGSTRIEPTNAVETATGSLRADLSEYAGETLNIATPGVGPAYGAVYAQFERQMDKVEAHACDDLDIEKTLLVRRGSEWEHWSAGDTLNVGDRVRVQLTIHCKRNLQYVCIEDDRPATFEPVKQLPGWEWSEGCGFYRENRDSRTDLHVVYMRPGTYLLNYDMNVNLAGTFSSGVATIQSQYAPEISAHSSGCVLRITNIINYPISIK